MIQQLLTSCIQLLFLNAMSNGNGSMDMATMLYSVANTFNQLMKQLQMNLQMKIIPISNSTSSTTTMNPTSTTMAKSLSTPGSTPIMGSTTTTVENDK